MNARHDLHAMVVASDAAAERHVLGCAAAGSRLGRADVSGSARSTLADVLGLAVASPYPENLDSIVDSLSDPEWLPKTGHVVLIDGIDRTVPDVRTLISDITCDALQRWRAAEPMLGYHFVLVSVAGRADLLVDLARANSALDDAGRRLNNPTLSAVPVIELD